MTRHPISSLRQHWHTTLLYLWLLLCASAALAGPQHYQYEIIDQRAHHPQLFTQGLLLDDDTLYESSGLYGQSMLVSYPLSSADTSPTHFTQQHRLAPKYFAEGLTLFNDALYQLTWREQTLFVYHRADFSPIKTLSYDGEGWGLTHDGTALIRSDGSHRLYFHDPEDFRVLRHIEVRERLRRVERLNELEYIRGRIWANIWKENRLVEIHPETGRVTGILDLEDLARRIQPASSESVLNGIAYDKQREAIWVTGKNWPWLFLLRLTPTPGQGPTTSPSP